MAWTRTGSKAAAALVAGLLCVAAPAPSGADAVAEPIRIALKAAKPSQVRAVKFDWLAKRGPAPRITLASAERMPYQIGKGSWICSPAGFGKKSRCYAN